MKISVENLYVDIGAYRVKEVSMFQWCGLGESCLFSIYNNQQLLNEAEQDMKNSAVRGACYPPRPKAGWITLSKICRIFHILRQPNSVIALLFIQNNSNFKNKLKMLTSVDVKFTSIVHLFREIQQIIKGLLRSANIILLAVLAMFLDNISPLNEYNVRPIVPPF